MKKKFRTRTVRLADRPQWIREKIWLHCPDHTCFPYQLTTWWQSYLSPIHTNEFQRMRLYGIPFWIQTLTTVSHRIRTISMFRGVAVQVTRPTNSLQLVRCLAKHHLEQASHPDHSSTDNYEKISSMMKNLANKCFVQKLQIATLHDLFMLIDCIRYESLECCK